MGYKLARWEVTGIPAPAPFGTLEFIMPAQEVTVKAVFEKIQLAKITVSTHDFGLVLGAPSTAQIGSQFTMAAIPLLPWRQHAFWFINGAFVGEGLLRTHTVTGDTSIEVNFSSHGRLR